MELFKLIRLLSANSLSLASNTLRLMRLELELAKKSLPVLAGLVFLLLCFITSLWVFLVSLLVVFLVAQGIGVYLTLFYVLALHVLLIVIVALLLRKYLGNLKLPATRKHLQSAFPSKMRGKP